MDIHVSVRYRDGTYIARANGTTASCAGEERLAVERLAEKVFGTLQRFTLIEVHRELSGTSYWRVSTDTGQACRICGCTWDHGCEGGCHWVGADLCSTCRDQWSDAA